MSAEPEISPLQIRYSIALQRCQRTAVVSVSSVSAFRIDF